VAGAFHRIDDEMEKSAEASTRVKVSQAEEETKEETIEGGAQ
jgi:hypothetical protein